MLKIKQMTSIIKAEHSTIKLNQIISKNISITFTFLIIVVSLGSRLLLLGSYDLLAEEAYYWNYAQHLDFSYLDHPPMVALLIKASTSIFGANEFGVRIPSLICWLLAAFFSFKLTELIRQGSGQYAVMLLSILPFFFLQSLVITPDQPLLVCWSAALYYLYRSLFFEESKCWYLTGVWLGLGMLSKYTIVLLGPTTLLYLIIVPTARHWFSRKEPYVCVLIAALLFTPVIYWNAIHEWASFVFQSSRRFHATSSFSFHYFIGILILFLLPSGIFGLWHLFNKKMLKSAPIDEKTQRFLQIFTIVPLSFFGIFSLNHTIKLDWIGPGLLAVVPWLAILATKSKKNLNIWFVGAIFLLVSYTGIIVAISFGAPERVSQVLFPKYISWSNLTEQVYVIAKNIEAKTHSTPIIVPLDLYNINSELTFYQTKLFARGDVAKIYPIMDRHIFGRNSLMYQYWSHKKDLSGKTLILISVFPSDFDALTFNKQRLEQSPLFEIWPRSQGRGIPIEPYYYKVVHLK